MPRTFTCQRCKVKITSDEVETMKFESSYKKRDVILCPQCFNSCRDTFTKWWEAGGKKDG